MSVSGVETVLRRAQDDAEFRRVLETEPDRALHGYDIEYEERQAIIAGDDLRLEELGVPREIARLAADFNPEGRSVY